MSPDAIKDDVVDVAFFPWLYKIRM